MVLISVKTLSRTQGLRAAGRIKSMTRFGIEPMTFPLLAQCLKGLRPQRTPQSEIPFYKPLT